MKRIDLQARLFLGALRVGPEQMQGENVMQMVARAVACALPAFLTYLIVNMATGDPSLSLAVAFVTGVFMMAALEGSRFRRIQGSLAQVRTDLVGLRSDLIAAKYVGDGPCLLGSRLPISWNHGTIAPDLAELLIQLILLKRPKRILECGPGASTIAMTLAIQSAGLDSHIFALEHALPWIEKTHLELAKLGLTDFVTIKHSPIELMKMEDRLVHWYGDLDWVGTNGPYDLIFVDGPLAESPGDPGREGALYAVWEYLNLGGLVILDDGKREHEVGCIRAWNQQFGERIRIQELSQLTKGAWLIERAA